MNPFAHKLLVLNKHSGPTSFDVVEAVRRVTGIRKVGHSGTLDPLASGVLLVCTGRATRAVEQFMNLDKTYEFTVRLGTETSTLDSEGVVTREAPVPSIADADVIKAAAEFIGEYDMVPPAFSAIKQNGKRLYELARVGEMPVADARTVFIHDLEVTSVSLPDIGFRMRCSRGTYVRSFARDFGARFGLPAYSKTLARTAIGPFVIENAYSCERLFTDDLEGLSGMDLSKALDFLPGVILNDASKRALVDGALPHSDDVIRTIGTVAQGSALRILDQTGCLLAIGNRGQAGRVGPVVDSFRLFVDRRSVIS
jgi:tRNA pseudouridine55 synthase